MSGLLVRWAGRPGVDWVPALVVGTLAARNLDAAPVVSDNFTDIAVESSAFMGICAAVVTFVMSNLIGSSNTRIKQIEATNGSALRRAWVGAISRCLLCAAVCLGGIVVHGYWSAVALGFIAGSLVLVLSSSLRSVYWLDLLWKAEVFEPIQLPDELAGRRLSA